MNLQFLRPKESENAGVGVAVKNRQKNRERDPTQCPLLYKPF